MSRLPLSQRLPGQAKKPQELLSWASDGDQVYYDDRALSYYYLPRIELERGDIDLTLGFNPGLPEKKKAVYLDKLLKGVIHYEKTENKKIEAQIVCWRGLITSLLVRSQQKVDHYAAQDELVVEVVKYDGQIFLYERPNPGSEEASANSVSLQRFVYSGYKFEQVATLPKPWGVCTRNEIDNRYTSSTPPDLGVEHCILVKSGVGGVDLVYGAEVDCVEQERQNDHDLSQYIELKTSKVVMDKREAIKFERKLMRTWIQSFLSGVPRVTYGFRDDNFILRSVETYRTQSIPTMVKNSNVTRPDQRWKGNDIIAFYNVLVHWLVDRVEEGKTYTLTCPQNGTEMRLQPADIAHDRKVAFLLDEFVEHRENFKSDA